MHYVQNTVQVKSPA